MDSNITIKKLANGMFRVDTLFKKEGKAVFGSKEFPNGQLMLQELQDLFFTPYEVGGSTMLLAKE